MGLLENKTKHFKRFRTIQIKPFHLREQSVVKKRQKKLRKSTQKYSFNDPDKMSFGISDTHIIIATNNSTIVLCQYGALSYPRDILSQRIKRRLYENSAALIVSICLTYFFTP